jgi:hypothetical protein
VIAGAPAPGPAATETVEEALRPRLASGMHTKAAAAEVAAELGVSKRVAYELATRLARAGDPPPESSIGSGPGSGSGPG